MIQRAGTFAVCLLVAMLAACSSSDSTATPPASTSVAPPAPTYLGGPTTDAGSRYLDAGAPLGGVVVETPPTAGTYASDGWPAGATSIARPVNPPAAPPPAATDLPPLPPPPAIR